MYSSLTRTQQDKMRANVQRGATVLDEKYPSWFKKINLDELDLGDCEACICGQLAYACGLELEEGDPFRTFAKKLLGKLSRGRRMLVENNWMTLTDEFGFDVINGLDNKQDGYRFLDSQWQRQIKRRLRQAAK